MDQEYMTDLATDAVIDIPPACAAEGHDSETCGVLYREVAESLLYTYSCVNANTTKTLEAVSFFYTLIELLSERGLTGTACEGMLPVQNPPMETSYRGRLL